MRLWEIATKAPPRRRTHCRFGFQAEERTIWQAPQTYAEMSPFQNADKIKQPLLLIHGAEELLQGWREAAASLEPLLCAVSTSASRPCAALAFDAAVALPMLFQLVPAGVAPLLSRHSWVWTSLHDTCLMQSYLVLGAGADDNNSGTFPMQVCAESPIKPSLCNCIPICQPHTDGGLPLTSPLEYLQSERFYAALKGNGAPARLVILPHESHGYRARESIMHTLQARLLWVAHCVMGKSHVCRGIRSHSWASALKVVSPAVIMLECPVTSCHPIHPMQEMDAWLDAFVTNRKEPETERKVAEPTASAAKL